MGRLIMKSIDKDRDRKQFSVPTADVASSSTDPYNTLATPYATLQAAFAAVMLTEIEDYTIAPTVVENTVDPSAQGNFAQNGITWNLEYTVNGMGGPSYNLIVPGADLNQGITRNGRIELDLSTGVGATLKTAFEASYFFPGTLENPSATNPGRAVVQAIYATQS